MPHVVAAEKMEPRLARIQRATFTKPVDFDRPSARGICQPATGKPTLHDSIVMPRDLIGAHCPSQQFQGILRYCALIQATIRRPVLTPSDRPALPRSLTGSLHSMQCFSMKSITTMPWNVPPCALWPTATMRRLSDLPIGGAGFFHPHRPDIILCVARPRTTWAMSRTRLPMSPGP